MRNWAEEHYKEVDKWLDIDNYRKFEDISLQALFHEIWARTVWFRDWPQDEELIKAIQFETKIFGGNPILFKPEQLNYITGDERLYEPPHIYLLTTERLAQISVGAMAGKLFSWNGVNKPFINPDYSGALISDVMRGYFPKSVMFEVDLAKGADDEIAESIKAALPQWRKMKGVEPIQQDPFTVGYGIISKIINNRLIPMLDILMWARLHDVRVGDDPLARMLYKINDKSPRGESKIHDTDRPLAMKVVTLDFTRKFNLFMNRQPHLKEMKVSDVMKLKEKN